MTKILIDEATVKLALDALQEVYWSSRSAKHDEAITDLRKALAEQPAQVEVCCGDYGKCMKPCTPRGKWLAEQPAQTLKELYALSREVSAEQPAQQKPVAWTLLLVGEHKGLVGEAGNKFAGSPEYYPRVDVYTTPQPAQRTWVGLTDEKADELVQRFARYELLRAIETELRSKNEIRS